MKIGKLWTLSIFQTYLYYIHMRLNPLFDHWISINQEKGEDRYPINQEKGEDRYPINQEKGEDRYPINQEKGEDRYPINRFNLTTFFNLSQIMTYI